MDSVVFYNPRIFTTAKIALDNHQLLTIITVGLVKTTFILVSTFLLDRVRKWPLLLNNVATMTISLGTLVMALAIIDHSKKKMTWALVLCMMVI
ncbi:hypothetical protein SLEP1_g29788 [Rubroshorea leprosula]|uniref:Uncharacterized protein n=1 Tax=Rubroshorea leprosula TaxID=152421 RepID=A0AAV5K4K3_9ROSI|nr:hypothetical protein SLEP1_g29788 [Rubroshorea leprosula]